MFAIQFNSQMRWAWFFLSFIFLGWVALRLVHPDESIATKLTLIAVCIINPGFLIVLVRTFRGPSRDCEDRSQLAAPLSAWGYFWRAYVAYLCLGPALYLLNLVVPVNLRIDRLSPGEIAVLEIPFALVGGKRPAEPR